MKNRIRLIAISSITVIAGVGLASCGGNRKTVAVVIPNVISMADFDAKFTKNNPLNIKLWTGFGATINTTLQDTILKDFEALYGGKITVKYESQGGYDSLFSAVNLSVTTETYPDVVLGYPDHFANYIYSGIQCDLNGYINSTSSTGVVAPGTLDDKLGLNLADFNQDFLKENRNLAFEDAAKTKPYTVGLPFNKSTEVMIYNKTMLDYFGFPKAPATWDEVRTVSESILSQMESKNLYNKKVYAEGANPETEDPILDFSGVTKSNFYPIGYDSQANFFITSLYQAGGAFTEPGETIEDGYIVFDTPETRTALNYFKKMNSDGILGIPYTWEEAGYCSKPFQARKLAMTISSSAGLSYNIPTGMAFEVGIAPVPYKNADTKAVISQGTNVAMLKAKGANADYINFASWLLIKYLTYSDANVKFAIDTGYLPVITAADRGENSEAYTKFTGSSNLFAGEKAKIDAARVSREEYSNLDNGWNRFVDPAFRGSSTIRNAVDTAMAMVMYPTGSKQLTVDEVIANLYKTLSAYKKA